MMPQALELAVLVSDPALKRKREHIFLKGALPNPSESPQGGSTNTRWRVATDVCSEEEPNLEGTAEGHWVLCHAVARGTRPNSDLRREEVRTCL
jgi:oligopeptide transport system ATP-binding protein